jgi:hypothetical protein
MVAKALHNKQVSGAAVLNTGGGGGDWGKGVQPKLGREPHCRAVSCWLCVRGVACVRSSSCQ